MSALSVASWAVISLGLFIDLWMVAIVVHGKATGRGASSVPVVSALFYLVGGGIASMAGDTGRWRLVGLLVCLHLIWHFAIMGRLSRGSKKAK